MPGRHSALKQVDPEIKQQLVDFKPAVEQFSGQQFAIFEPVVYTTQIVAGCNFRVKYQVGDNDYIHAQVFVPLPHTGSPPYLLIDKIFCNI